MRKEGFEYDHVFDWILIAPNPSNMINFTVESFDDIKSVNRNKPLAKDHTMGNESQPSLSQNDGGTATKRTNEKNELEGKEENTAIAMEPLIQDENDKEEATKREEENHNDSSAQLI